MSKFWNVFKQCFSGLFTLVTDGPSTFALITLVAVVGVTFFKPIIGGLALAAFCTAVPGILSWTAHKVTLAQLAGGIVAPQNQSTTIAVTTDSTLPPNGVL